MLVPFTDDPQLGQSSQQVLKSWLEVVEAELAKQTIKPWTVEGGYLPINNDSTETNQALNRRIEVWVL
ncbi:MAG: hypothetical protein V2I33_14845 [Kangiellaceae bacterium]|nr:hypothetical protein [Kangiellaceae bacterium]